MNISTAFSAGRLTVYLTGELDHHAARCAIHTIDELLDEYLPRDCALDMSGLSFMDSSGIAVIIRVSRRMKGMDRKPRAPAAAGDRRLGHRPARPGRAGALRRR